MSTWDPSQEQELVVQGRKAAYCARRRLNGAGDLLTTQDMEDLVQTATLAYWKHHREGRPVPFCFVCARQYEGLPLTTVLRTLVDVAAAGLTDEQVQ